MFSIKIIEKLPINRWSEYKDLYIKAVTNEPLAFSETPKEIKNKTKKEWIKELQDSIDGNSIIIFAESDGIIVGMGTGSFHRFEKLSHNAFISSLYIDTEFRNQGIGKKIIEKIIKLISKNKKIKNIFSEIIETQTSSIKLHKKIGFKIVGKFNRLFKVNGKSYTEISFQKEI